jgi:hypothetical protein
MTFAFIKKHIRGFFVALAFGIPDFSHAKDEASGRSLKAPLEEETNQLRAGTTQKVEKTWGVTIAGGPGSQRLCDAFDALPPEEKQRMLDARKGIIRQATVAEMFGETPEGGSQPVDRLRRGLDAVMRDKYMRKPSGELTTREKPSWQGAPTGVDSSKGKKNIR